MPLQDALQAIVAQGGTKQAPETWPLTRALRIGDRAVGVPVLMTLYEQMKATPVAPDLAALWQRLGVRLDGDQVIFDHNAPQAELRKALIRPLMRH